MQILLAEMIATVSHPGGILFQFGCNCRIASSDAKLKNHFCLKSASLNTREESCELLKLGDIQIFCNIFPLLGGKKPNKPKHNRKKSKFCFSVRYDSVMLTSGNSHRGSGSHCSTTVLVQSRKVETCGRGFLWRKPF